MDSLSLSRRTCLTLISQSEYQLYRDRAKVLASVPQLKAVNRDIQDLTVGKIEESSSSLIRKQCSLGNDS
jgi:hypothetical protein